MSGEILMVLSSGQLRTNLQMDVTSCNLQGNLIRNKIAICAEEPDNFPLQKVITSEASSFLNCAQ